MCHRTITEYLCPECKRKLRVEDVTMPCERATKDGVYCDNDKTSCSTQRGDSSVRGCVDCMRKKKKDKDQVI